MIVSCSSRVLVCLVGAVDYVAKDISDKTLTY